jgi:ferredoxin-NADP reductase
MHGNEPDCLAASGLLRRVPDLRQRDVYLFGPPAMAEAACRGLSEAGLPAGYLHEERFAF